MSHPSPDFFAKKLSIGFNESGAPTFVDDLWNLNAALDADGVNDSLDRAEVVTDNATPKFSYAIWIKTTTTAGGLIMCQLANAAADASDRGCFFLQMNGNGTLSPTFFTTSSSNMVFSSSTNAGPFYNDGNLHHILITGNGNDVNIFTDGTEVTYQNQNFVSGSGFTSIVNNSKLLGIANQIGGSSNLFFDGEVTRPKIWLQTEITTAQALEEFNDEEAAQGEGFFVPIQGGVGRPSFRLDPNRQTRYNRGPLRFKRM